MADPAVPKGTDEEGWSTVAKYSNTSLTSERNLDHARQIRSDTVVDASTEELRGLAGELMATSQMQSHTGVFDTTALPALPGFARLGCGVPAPKQATWQ